MNTIYFRCYLIMISIDELKGGEDLSVLSFFWGGVCVCVWKGPHYFCVYYSRQMNGKKEEMNWCWKEGGAPQKQKTNNFFFFFLNAIKAVQKMER